jgi:hypothetical protein
VAVMSRPRPDDFVISRARTRGGVQIGINICAQGAAA